MWNTSNSVYVCRNCHFTAKAYHEKCPNCGTDNMANCGKKARPPKKNAKQKVWNEFFERFDWDSPEKRNKRTEDIQKLVDQENKKFELLNWLNPDPPIKKTPLEKLNILLLKKKPIKKKSYHD